MATPDNNSIISAVSALLLNVKTEELELLNSGAPNSWAILDKKNNEVWKIPKSGGRKKTAYLLEKDALDRIPEGINVIKYSREGLLAIHGQIKRFPYFVFPYISDSRSLEKEIRERKTSKSGFSNDEIKKMGKDLVSIIKSLYSVGLVHQDVKPGNILIKGDGEVTLIDLGIALFTDSNPLHEIKKMKGPYAYLSPEKLDLIADLSDFNKRRISFTSDLFSAGMILFEMATFSRLPDLMEPGEIRNAHQKLVELGIETDLVEMLSGLLDPNIVERQRRSSSYFGIDWFAPAVTNVDINLWLQHGSNGIDYLDQLLLEHTFHSKWGVIFGADQIRSDTNEEKYILRSQAIKDKSGLVAVDPCTYRLQFTDEHHSYLINRTYGTMMSPGYFTNDKVLKKGIDFTQDVIEFQKKFEPDIYISPYFIIQNLDDHWIDANFASFHIANKVVNDMAFREDLYFGIFLSESFLLNTSALDELITQILLDVSIQNVYLRLESCRDDSEPNEDPTYLRNVKRFIEALAKNKNLLLGYADIESLGWLGCGLNGIGINPDYSKRKSQVIEVMTKPKKEIKIPKKKPRYFAQKLLNDILAQDELRSPHAKTLGSGTELLCSCPFCFIDGDDRRLDPDQSRKHFIWNFEKYIHRVQNKTVDERKQIFLSMLDEAQKSYVYLETKCSLRFSASTDSSFIPVWQANFS